MTLVAVLVLLVILVLAVPVAQESMVRELAREVDEIVCVLKPRDLYGIGLWYDQFAQLDDQDVQAILARPRVELVDSARRAATDERARQSRRRTS